MLCDENVSVVSIVNCKLTCIVLGVKNVQKKCLVIKEGVQEETLNSKTHYVSMNGTPTEVCVSLYPFLLLLVVH